MGSDGQPQLVMAQVIIVVPFWIAYADVLEFIFDTLSREGMYNL